jgi:hypothetical protein
MADPRDIERQRRAAVRREAQLKASQREKVQAEQHIADKAARKIDKATRRATHTDSDFEGLLCEAEQRGWLVWRDDGYFKCQCSCAERHYNTVVLTPSSRRTLRNTRSRFERSECWE